MDTKNRTAGKTTAQVSVRATVQATAAQPAAQIQVRSDLRSGGDLETCQYNLDKWRERYYYWYNVARTAGKI